MNIKDIKQKDILAYIYLPYIPLIVYQSYVPSNQVMCFWFDNNGTPHKYPIDADFLKPYHQAMDELKNAMGGNDSVFSDEDKTVA